MAAARAVRASNASFSNLDDTGVVMFSLARRARAAAASIPCDAARAVSSASRTRCSIALSSSARKHSAALSAPSTSRNSAHSKTTSASLRILALLASPPLPLPACTAATPRVTGVACTSVFGVWTPPAWRARFVLAVARA
eukprot:scaffold140867_cov31-Tisochrysis_lutea.AAC.3